MSFTNRRVRASYTTNDAGTVVPTISVDKQLRRLVLASMLFEDAAYIDGVTHTEALKRVVAKADPKAVASLAIEARTKYMLRHIPLFLMRELARIGKLKAADLFAVIQRPDEIGEFISLYWEDKKQPLSNQVKKGIAMAFTDGPFSEYTFAKWDKGSAAISLRDALFLCHPKPKDVKQEALFKKIANKELKTPDTWEVALSGGADKRTTFERLMADNKLGALAFLRNLRNMRESGITIEALASYGAKLDVSKVLPFRFVAAAKACPELRLLMQAMMLKSIQSKEKLPGRSVLIIDTSGSMGAGISYKSDMTRIQAAGAMAAIAKEMCEDVVIYATAGSDGNRKHATVLISDETVGRSLRGMELVDYLGSRELTGKIGGGGIFFTQVMQFVAEAERGSPVDRVIVFTDEQDTSSYGRAYNPATAKRLAPAGRNYIINVGSNTNGINSAEWETITGFSEAVFDYIKAVED